MKNIFKKIAVALLAMCVMLSVISSPLFVIDISAASSGTGYTSAADVVYKKSGNYIYNWGAREEDCVFLSTYAQAFYTGSYVYDTLSAVAGGSNQSNAPQSSLYSSLKALMTDRHKTQTSYGGTRDLYKYTDCEKNGSKISSFYSGQPIGPNWGSSPSWNREHTWPNSKGLGGNDENDIMMLRPTATSENSSRGNTAYGKSSSYYNPNSASGGEYDLRGDCARICLYVYVRWGNTYKMWGAGGVIESMAVLLEWMEQDPVDTWEMGRNDAVQSITGTRNVFVDYPEYAWLLFGQNVPSDMVTPSGEASNGTATPKPDNGGNTGNNENTGNNGGSTITPPVTDNSTTGTASKTASELISANSWSSSTTKQSFNLDGVVSVKINGGEHSGKSYGDNIRIYATDAPAGSMTISVKDGYELVSVKITTDTGTYAYLCIGLDSTDISNKLTSVSGTSVVLNAIRNGTSGKQVRIKGIEVNYKAIGADTPTTPDPETTAPETNAPATEAPETNAPATEAPETNTPATEAPTTNPPATEAPGENETDKPVTAGGCSSVAGLGALTIVAVSVIGLISFKKKED